MIYVYAAGLTLLNFLFWGSILFGLPGTWLMLLAALLLDWLQPGEPMFGAASLYSSAGLALLGEIAEFVFGAAGARQAGGSRRGAAFAILGGVIGAIVGTGLPVPILGTLIGACAGAFAGSVFGDLLAGRTVDRSVEAGRGAAAGRLWGTISKMAIGGLICGILTVAAFS
jgi:uncharacterized protein YqgC (DUF456 family)